MNILEDPDKQKTPIQKSRERTGVRTRSPEDISEWEDCRNVITRKNSLPGHPGSPVFPLQNTQPLKDIRPVSPDRPPVQRSRYAGSSVDAKGG